MVQPKTNIPIYGLTPQHKAHSSSAVRKQSGDRHQRRLNTFPPHTRSSWMSLMSLRAEYGPNAQHHPIIHPRIRKGTSLLFSSPTIFFFTRHIQAQTYTNTRRSSPEAVEYVPATHIVQLDELDEPACSVRTQCSTSSKHPSPHHHSHRFPTRQVFEASH